MLALIQALTIIFQKLIDACSETPAARIQEMLHLIQFIVLSWLQPPVNISPQFLILWMNIEYSQI